MSATDDEDVEIPGREIAYRLFAAEYDDASVSYAESDEERAPNYVISPTGARINRLFAVGTLTEVTQVNEEMVRARVVDPTGAFVVYAGQYQPDALAVLEKLEPPAFVAVTGKARTFQPEDSDQVYTSIRPESIATVDADTRDRWVVATAEQTVERIGTYAAAAGLDASGDDLTDALVEAGVESGLAAGIPLAQDNYGTTPSYLAALRDCAHQAVAVVAGDRDQVDSFDALPAQTAPAYEDVTFDSLADLGDVELDVLESVVATEAVESPEPEPESTEPAAATAGNSDTDADSIGTSSAAGTATSDERDSTADAETEAVVDSAVDDTNSDAVSDSDVEADSNEDVDTDADADLDTDADSDTDSDSDSEHEPTATFDESAAETSTDTPADEDASDAADEDASDAADEDASDAADEDASDEDAEDDLGNFDADDVDDGMYEMDEDEREQIEEEFGTEFTSGSEVDEPGEAGIDVEVDADADAAAADVDAADTETETDDEDELGAPPASGLEETESEDEPAEEEPAEDEPESDTDDAVSADESDDDASGDDSDTDEPAEDVDLQDVVIETMGDLDDGDGADRSELVETVAADTGADEADVEDAIQDALMGGQCYEPNDETLKPI